MNGKVKHSQADSKVLQERNFKVYSGSRTQVYTPCFKGRFCEKYLGSVRTLTGALKEKGHVALKRGRGEGGGGRGRHRVFKRKRSGEGITYRQQNIKDCQ